MRINMGEKKKYIICGLAAIIVLLFDQVTKWLIDTFLPPHKMVVVVPGFFDLINIRNRGAAFGFLNRADIEWQFWLFLGATILAIWAIFSLLRSFRYQLLMSLGMGLILGGALGNMLDRVRYRAVIDFLDFYWHGWHWPAFNVADIGICAGAGLTCLALWRQKPGNKA